MKFNINYEIEVTDTHIIYVIDGEQRKIEYNGSEELEYNLFHHVLNDFRIKVSADIMNQMEKK